jgi:hypothetical protein
VFRFAPDLLTVESSQFFNCWPCPLSPLLTQPTFTSHSKMGRNTKEKRVRRIIDDGKTPGSSQKPIPNSTLTLALTGHLLPKSQGRRMESSLCFQTTTD